MVSTDGVQGRERKMEFIIDQQAQFAADIQQLKELHAQAGIRFSRVEESLVLLVQVARSSDARLDTLTEAQTRTENALSSLTQKIAELAEAQVHTEQRLNALIDIVQKGRNGIPSSS